MSKLIVRNFIPYVPPGSFISYRISAEQCEDIERTSLHVASAVVISGRYITVPEERSRNGLATIAIVPSLENTGKYRYLFTMFPHEVVGWTVHELTVVDFKFNENFLEKEPLA